MKLFSLFICFSFLTTSAIAQKTDSVKLKLDPNKKTQIVETACGQCQLGLPGKSCDLAVRINGKAYFVDGTSIDDHGDAHAKTGFCNAIRNAEVQGEIKDSRFKATYFKLVTTPDKKELKD
jgi:hypothetical protein